MKRDYIEPGIAKCAYPKQLQEKLILTTPSSQFICNGGYNVLRICVQSWYYYYAGSDDFHLRAKCDLCLSSPCQNGASCESKPNRDYQCHCEPGFYGKNCEAIIDACYGNPCANDGRCNVMEAGRFT